jgi:hypothetical protein
MPGALVTLKQFRDSIRGHSNGSTDRVEWLLRLYHAKAGTEVAERVRLASELVEVCKKYRAGNGIADPRFAGMVNAGMTAEKDLANMTRAKAGWGAARKIFAPSAHAHGKTNTLQHYNKHAADPTQKQNYWLEGLDPKHRSWGHEGAGLFAQWLADVGSPLNFFAWLEANNLGRGIKEVQYLAPDQRWKYMCVFGDDKVMYRHMHGVRGNGTIPLERFTTWGLETAHSGANFAIWACSPGGIFYTNTHKVSEFHHSTFLSGGRVLAAGEWVVAAGKLLLISHKTGHHAASPMNLLSALRLLDLRLDLSRTAVQVTDYSTHRTIYTTAREFLTNSGSVSACGECRDLSGNILDMKALAQYRCAMHQDWDLKVNVKPRAFA